jgi:membrane protein implicated in regulation of membrane protease activity
MQEFINDWLWLCLAGILLALEVLAPGFVLIWFAVAAFVVGIADLVFGLGLQTEIVLFAVLSIVAVVVGRRYFSPTRPVPATDINNRTGAMIGQVFTLPEAVENGAGYILVSDSRWRVLGPDLPKGARVEVIGVEGASLKIKPAD